MFPCIFFNMKVIVIIQQIAQNFWLTQRQCVCTHAEYSVSRTNTKIQLTLLSNRKHFAGEKNKHANQTCWEESAAATPNVIMNVMVGKQNNVGICEVIIERAEVGESNTGRHVMLGSFSQNAFQFTVFHFSPWCCFSLFSFLNLPV